MPIPQYKNKCVCNVSNHFPEYKKKSKQTAKHETQIRYVDMYLHIIKIKKSFRIYIQAHVHNLQK